MTKIYKSKISKEDFKVIMTTCFKSAWITYNKENFLQALEWKKNKKYEYFIENQIESEEDFNSDSSSIDLFETYNDLLNDNFNENKEKLKTFDQHWTDEEGFVLEKFVGEQIENGNAVGLAAREYYSIINAKENLENKLNKKILDLSDETFEKALKSTTQNLTNKEISYIFEATFQYDENNFKTRCDILKIKENRHVEIIEFKATAKVKKEHFFDLLYQVWVLEKNGMIVDNVFLGHLNNEYLTDYGSVTKTEIEEFINSFGEINFLDIKDFVNNDFHVEPTKEKIDVDYNKLFIIDENFKNYKKGGIKIIDSINSFREVNDLDELFSKYSDMFSWDKNKIEKYFDFDYCDSPFIFNNNILKWENEFLKNENNCYCFHVVKWFDKNRQTLFNIPNLANKTKAKLYKFSDKIYLDDISSLDASYFPLNEKNKSEFNEKHYIFFDSYKKYQQNGFQINWSDCVNKQAIGELNNMLNLYKNFPVYMYDFETIKWAIPKFALTSAYMQIPFQYSVDIIYDENFDYNNAENTMKHFDFISKNKKDPRPAFIQQFLKDMFSQGPGVYVAYYKSFEKNVLKKLAFLFPEYAKPLLFIAQNTIDLMDFFQGNKSENRSSFLIYHPDFAGSCSIKKTQPALDPKFSYKDLKINKGDKASQTFREYVEGLVDENAWKKLIKEDMIKYCNRDTLAMVVILQRIQEIFNDFRKENPQWIN
ncbi:hypothetical protein ESOMN_v1c04200 [Williamsoniiplasma somnilux]|uniref:DUF2779 domain-containing protein n=1 Tax=Williamsoniiplasma somnilux TaxID=215578 RepID=A0A2K8NY97_9MOLU|nr:DUF2779 domain-containing protein [Williamsoniiplasma somnilux]ATZ18802.1 hypothetical protein ESOMN_v1c04200 [Williamsoniiplasma somnilux]